MTFLAKDQTQNREMIIAELGVGKDPIPPGQLRFMVNTGGEGRESIVILKFIDLRADNIQGNGVQIQARPPGQPTPPPPRPKSPFDSFLDLFR